MLYMPRKRVVKKKAITRKKQVGGKSLHAGELAEVLGIFAKHTLKTLAKVAMNKFKERYGGNNSLKSGEWV